MSQSDVCNTIWKQYTHVIHGAFGIERLDGDVACRGGPRRAVGPSALACCRVGTAQTSWEPVHELLVQALRDAQQSVDASTLQFCYCTRGEGAVLGVTRFADISARLIAVALVSVSSCASNEVLGIF